MMNPHQNGKIARLPKRLGRGAWIGGGAEPPGTRGAAARCEGREFARPVPFAVLLNQEEFCLTPPLTSPLLSASVNLPPPPRSG